MEIFKDNFRLFIIGGCESGKTTLAVNILLSDNLISPPVGDIIVCYSHMQPIFTKLTDKYGNKVHFYRDFTHDLLDEDFLRTLHRPILFLDDCLEYFRDSKGKKLLEKLMTHVSHHGSLSVIATYQTLFTATSAINAQVTHYIIKRLPDLSNIQSFARRLVGKEYAKSFEKVYSKITEDNKYNYLLCDLNYDDKTLQLQTNILCESYPYYRIVYALKPPSKRIFRSAHSISNDD